MDEAFEDFINKQQRIRKRKRREVVKVEHQAVSESGNSILGDEVELLTDHIQVLRLL